ncbi:MAG: ABC-F family ATP-binding cassette domain-containing protein [Bacilli bacterium]|nr:ABC-F family ATP-binding cassette domain-containing protein [Bacilli bacterium]
MNGFNMNLSFGLEDIYVNANFSLNKLDKVGIAGVNGAGKTTLFKILLKEVKLDSGKINIGNATLGYLPQEILFDEDISVYQYILSARPINKLEKELKKLYDEYSINQDDKISKRIDDVLKRLEYYDYYNYENIILELMDSMGIDIEILDMKLSELSGGQKSKIAFLRLLYSKKDILLLDEPTNHLDKTTREFIINYLKRYRGMVLIISHDVEFLDSIVNKILYIDKANCNITVYDGNYTLFMEKYNREKEFKERLILKEEKEIEDLKKFIDKANNASRTNHNLKRMGKDRKSKLEHKLNNLTIKDNRYKTMRLNIKSRVDGSKIPLVVDNLNFGYDRPLYNNLSFTINKNERFLIVGNNGIGKSTLLKLINGILKPNSGIIKYGNKTDIAYYAQELELLDLDKSIMENVDNNSYSINELRSILASFLFFDDDVFKKVKVLSPGEKARIALCKVALKRANLLLLDEPTNHLDPDTQKVIADNFNLYDGTIIMVSHNISFIENIKIDRMLLLPSGKVLNYDLEVLMKYIDD